MSTAKKPIDTAPNAKATTAVDVKPAPTAPVDPSKVPGNYAIVMESGGQRRVFEVHNGIVQIVPSSALQGAFELK